MKNSQTKQTYRKAQRFDFPKAPSSLIFLQSLRQNLFFLFFLMTLSLGCSQQTLEVSHNIDEKELNTILDQLLGKVQISSANTEINTWRTGAERLSVFVSDTHDGFGKPQNVVALTDFSFMGVTSLSGSYFTEFDLQDATVAFVDGQMNGARNFYLLVNLVLPDRTEITRTFRSTEYLFENDTFWVKMENESGTPSILLRSYNLDPHAQEELGANIQLFVSLLGSSGDEIPIGKFSALAGFEVL